jgi:hypothetical protein
MEKPRSYLTQRIQDRAQIVRGGIDLSRANNVLQTQNNNGEIKFHIDPAMLKQLQNAPGFVPVIISIRPMTDLRRFLGLSETNAPLLTH